MKSVTEGSMGDSDLLVCGFQGFSFGFGLPLAE